jgi:hypothetical protein
MTEVRKQRFHLCKLVKNCTFPWKRIGNTTYGVTAVSYLAYVYKMRQHNASVASFPGDRSPDTH